MPYRRRLIADSLLPVVERIHYFLQMVLMMGAPPNVIDGPRRGCVEPQKTTVTSEIITFGAQSSEDCVSERWLDLFERFQAVSDVAVPLGYAATRIDRIRQAGGLRQD
jgi:hypothetical protein